MNANEMLLSIRDLSIAFGSGAREFLAVDRVSFDIGKGETVAVVGESGSGKSVTALSVMKLLPYPSAHHPSGSIMFKGRDLLPLSERQMRHVRGNDITIIFQEPMTSLNPLHTIEKQIGEILELHQGVTGQAARARILDLLDQVFEALAAGVVRRLRQGEPRLGEGLLGAAQAGVAPGQAHVHRPDVGPSQIEEQKHFRGPAPDPAHLNQTLDNLVVGHFGQGPARWHGAFDCFGGEIF